MIWFIRVQFDQAATEEQAEIFARDVGQCFVDGTTGRTEVIIYSMYASIHAAATAVMNTMYPLTRQMGFLGDIIQIEIMPQADRMAELEKEDLVKDPFP